LPDVQKSTASSHADETGAREAIEEVHAGKAGEVVIALVLNRIIWGTAPKSPWEDPLLYKVRFSEEVTLRTVHIWERTGVGFTSGDFVTYVREEDKRDVYEQENQLIMAPGTEELEQDLNVKLKAGKWLYYVLNLGWPDDGMGNYPEFIVTFHFEKRRS